jgi:hypothetical protein
MGEWDQESSDDGTKYGEKEDTYKFNFRIGTRSNIKVFKDMKLFRDGK